MTVPEARSNQRLRRYELRTLRVPLGKGMLSLTIPEARRWLREGSWVPDTQRGREPPYWVEVWPASLAAAQLLARRGIDMGLRVLDLGCGLGLPGIAAASLGADVTFADREADALEFARWNATHIGGRGEAVHCQQLDWSREQVAGSFDIVVLADVTYHAVHHAALWRQLDRCLRPDGVVVHADPCRPESTAFLAGLTRDRGSVGCLRDTCAGERRLVVRLVVASRSPAALGPWRTAFAADRHARPLSPVDAAGGATPRAADHGAGVTASAPEPFAP